MSKGRVYIGIDKSGSYRVSIALTTKMVEEARKMHMTTPLATAALGRVLTATAMMSLELKADNNRLSLLFQGDGPARQILATGYGNGNVKGYISNPIVDLPLNKMGKLDVGGAIGKGELFVTKDLGMKEPYVGAVKLVTGEIAEDLTSYFLNSEQKATSVALGVKVGKKQNVLTAGGMIIEVLPDAEEEAIEQLEKTVLHMPPITSCIEENLMKSANLSDEEILQNIAGDIFKNMNEKYQVQLLEFKEISLNCDCTRQRIEEALMTIGKKEIEEILREDEQAELGCHFCGKRYLFDKEDLERILENIEK